MNKIKLNFINKSNDRSNSSIVIFQKNAATSYDQLAVAWKVIENCGEGDNHPFEYSYDMEVSAGDSHGNFTRKLGAFPGNRFEMIKDDTGDVLKLTKEYTSSPKDVEVVNHLNKGAISANIYRSGTLLAKKKVVAPGSKAVFQFLPKIFIGVTSEIQQGEVMNSAVIKDLNTQISLSGILSADIVMTGGSSNPYEFSLDNVVYA
ncbi:hypothetical protein [Flavivirga eckloniae]|uniref:Aromatic ring-opening dioxygenase LigA n=1 Tax=Flavivirga eckloniae TaxID=1803846 RepID=A0A2K9PK22_9FLAO|nr:hypothetical protein [Flavivirga eckloniae]AUP77376.1 hypothetical protein C1H87_01025 [Flavivirga eckloniae]